MTLNPLIAKFLLYISNGETPKDASEMATIDTSQSKCLNRLIEKGQYEKFLDSKRRAIYSFLHPEVSSRIKEGAFLLTYWFLNFDALEDGELKKIEEYIDSMKEYFQ